MLAKYLLSKLDFQSLSLIDPVSEQDEETSLNSRIQCELLSYADGLKQLPTIMRRVAPALKSESYRLFKLENFQFFRSERHQTDLFLAASIIDWARGIKQNKATRVKRAKRLRRDWDWLRTRSSIARRTSPRVERCPWECLRRESLESRVSSPVEQRFLYISEWSDFDWHNGGCRWPSALNRCVSFAAATE